MTSQHTPGPWRFERGTSTIRSEPANYWLASMNSFDGAVNHEANARLIAAAPDLLEALKLAQLAVSELCYEQDPANECWNVLQVVNSAIAKAEGQP